MKKLDCFLGAKSVALITHIEPDADAICSAYVFRNFLSSQFKIKCVDIFAETPGGLFKNLVPVLDGLNINEQHSKYYDIAVILDCPNIDRIGEYQNMYNSAKLKINIDHHNTNIIVADKKFNKVVSSTCEIVYELIKPYKYNLTKEDKGRIYAGIITDTNNLSVGAMGKGTFKVVSEIIEDIDNTTIYNHFFANNSLKNMQVLSRAIENLKTYENNKILLTHLYPEDVKELKCSFNDYVGIINRLAAINGCCLVCFIQPKNGEFYVSMRARRGYDVSQIALSNGGGGHKGAAAYVSTKAIKEIEQQVLKAFRNELKNHLQETKTKIF